MSPSAKSSKKSLLKKIKKSTLLQNFLVYFGYFYILIVYKTSKWQRFGDQIIDEYANSDRPFMICFWHGRLLMMPFIWRWRHRETRMLSSPHSDGVLIARILNKFGIGTTYGSKSSDKTNKGGAKASLELIGLSKNGVVFGVTPDGPRGPVHQVAEGVAMLSKWTKADMIPTTYAISRCKRLKSWDKFILALPFAKGAFVVGRPVSFTKDDDDIERVIKELKANLDIATEQAENIVN